MERTSCPLAVLKPRNKKKLLKAQTRAKLFKCIKNPNDTLKLLISLRLFLSIQ